MITTVQALWKVLNFSHETLERSFPTLTGFFSTMIIFSNLSVQMRYIASLDSTMKIFLPINFMFIQKFGISTKVTRVRKNEYVDYRY